MDDEAAGAAEDRVVGVLALDGVADLPALAGALEVAAEVPAAGALAEVPAERALVAQLRARGRGGPLGERGPALRDLRGARAISASVARAPMRSPPSFVAEIPFSSARPERLTTDFASKTPSRRQPTRSVPPAWARAPGSERAFTASATERGRT